jgi:hypothetical protein
MSRFIQNTTYAVQVDVVTTETGLFVEQGTLHVINNKLKVHLDGEIKEIVLIPNAPAEGQYFLQSNDGVISWELFNQEQEG